MKNKKSSFRGKVTGNSKTQQTTGNSYGYLNAKGIPFYNPTPGSRESFDIVPYPITDPKHLDLSEDVGIEVGDLWYKKPIRVHKNVGVDNDSVICLGTFGQKCPICEYRKKRAQEGADKDELKAYNSQLRNLYIVIPRGVKKLDEVPHIMDISQFLFQNLLNEELEEDNDNEIFPDPEVGKTLTVRWSKETFNGNTYAEASKISFKDRDEAIDLEDVPNLDECLKVLSYKQIEAKFLEMETDEDDDDKDKKPKSSPKSKKDEDDDPDDEPEETPTKNPFKTDKKQPKLTWDDLSDMDETELCEVIENKNLDIDPDDYDEDELKRAIAEELEIEIPKKKPARQESKKEPEPKKKPAEAGDAKKCPSGYKFGVDTDTKDECDDCVMWAKCDKAKEG